MHVEKGDVVLSFLLNIRGRWQVNYRIFSSVCFIPYGLDQIQRGFQSDKDELYFSGHQSSVRL